MLVARLYPLSVLLSRNPPTRGGLRGERRVAEFRPICFQPLFNPLLLFAWPATTHRSSPLLGGKKHIRIESLLNKRETGWFRTLLPADVPGSLSIRLIGTPPLSCRAFSNCSIPISFLLSFFPSSSLKVDIYIERGRESVRAFGEACRNHKEFYRYGFGFSSGNGNTLKRTEQCSIAKNRASNIVHRDLPP